MSRPALQGVGEGRRFCLVVSRFNEPVTESMAAAARECLVAHGAEPGAIRTVAVPGAWELPQAVRWVVDAGGVDGVIALGCVIRGETPHFEYVSLAATTGLAAIARDSQVAIAFGVLTTDDGAQARARSGGNRGNKGEDAALAVLEMCALAEDLRGAS